MNDQPRWITCQIGFRDHYLVPRVLHDAGVLHRGYTELWVRPGSALHRLGGGKLRQRLRERFHPALADAPMEAWNYRALVKELTMRARGLRGWDMTLERDRWFQRICVQRLEQLRVPDGAPVTIFAYSYAAREIFEYAKSRGWKSVMGQMDAGQYDERLMIDLYDRHRAISAPWARIPAEYWANWKEECALADRIVVNSTWSQHALIREGVAADKLRIIPLAFESPVTPPEAPRSYPTRFTAERPLRVLFLGQVNVRKGAAEMLEAMDELRDEPVELTVVGPVHLDLPQRWRGDPRIKWVGYLPRSQALEHYVDADVFLFPSHSDGFGMTQLEAQAQRVPVIASRFCGDVVNDGVNGLLLDEVSGVALADALRRALRDPALLSEFAKKAVVTSNGPEAYGKALLNLD